MCSKMCRKTDAGAGGSALPQAAVALWAAHFYYNYIRMAEDRGDKAKADVPSGLADFVSAISPFEELCLLKALVERCPMSSHGDPGVLRPRLCEAEW